MTRLVQRPRVEEAGRRARRVMPGGNTRTTVWVAPAPPLAARAEGCRVVDVDGHCVIDLQANYTSLVHGHGRPEVRAAALAAMDEVACVGLPTLAELELAEHLVARVPALERLRFAASGTEAVMMAIRAARAATGRDVVLTFEGCYHGSYDAVATRARGLSSAGRDERRSVPFGDASAFEALCAADGEQLACVVLDLLPSRAGLVPPSDAFVALVRETTRRYGIVLVLDEVVTLRLHHAGLGALRGLAPDLVTMGKLIGGGFPIGAFGGRAELMEAFDPARDDAIAHGGTFTANPVSMRAGLAALELLTAAEIARINALGETLRERLRALGYEVAGEGSLLRVSEAEAQDALWWRLYEHGILIGTSGLACVTTAMDAGTIEEVCERFAAARAAA